MYVSIVVVRSISPTHPCPLPLSFQMRSLCVHRAEAQLVNTVREAVLRRFERVTGMEDVRWVCSTCSITSFILEQILEQTKSLSINPLLVQMLKGTCISFIRTRSPTYLTGNT